MTAIPLFKYLSRLEELATEELLSRRKYDQAQHRLANLDPHLDIATEVTYGLVPRIGRFTLKSHEKVDITLDYAVDMVNSWWSVFTERGLETEQSQIDMSSHAQMVSLPRVGEQHLPYEADESFRMRIHLESDADDPQLLGKVQPRECYVTVDNPRVREEMQHALRFLSRTRMVHGLSESKIPQQKIAAIDEEFRGHAREGRIVPYALVKKVEYAPASDSRVRIPSGAPRGFSQYSDTRLWYGERFDLYPAEQSFLMLDLTNEHDQGVPVQNLADIQNYIAQHGHSMVSVLGAKSFLAGISHAYDSGSSKVFYQELTDNDEIYLGMRSHIRKEVPLLRQFYSLDNLEDELLFRFTSKRSTESKIEQFADIREFLRAFFTMKGYGPECESITAPKSQFLYGKAQQYLEQGKDEMAQEIIKVADEISALGENEPSLTFAYTRTHDPHLDELETACRKTAQHEVEVAQTHHTKQVNLLQRYNALNLSATVIRSLKSYVVHFDELIQTMYSERVKVENKPHRIILDSGLEATVRMLEAAPYRGLPQTLGGLRGYTQQLHSALDENDAGTVGKYASEIAHALAVTFSSIDPFLGEHYEREIEKLEAFVGDYNAPVPRDTSEVDFNVGDIKAGKHFGRQFGVFLQSIETIYDRKRHALHTVVLDDVQKPAYALKKTLQHQKSEIAQRTESLYSAVCENDFAGVLSQIAHIHQQLSFSSLDRDRRSVLEYRADFYERRSQLVGGKK